MAENERIKELRKSLNLTMEKFGERVGVTKVAISLIESGKSNITAQMRRSICREFGVSEEWLRDGVGEMMRTSYSEEISALAQTYGLDAADQAIIVEYARLSPDERQVVKRYIERSFLASRCAVDGGGPSAPADRISSMSDQELVADLHRALSLENRPEDASAPSSHTA